NKEGTTHPPFTHHVVVPLLYTRTHGRRNTTSCIFPEPFIANTLLQAHNPLAYQHIIVTSEGHGRPFARQPRNGVPPRPMSVTTSTRVGVFLLPSNLRLRRFLVGPDFFFIF
ncbi:unnamed protein product, partial [Pylaiella littoralis]